MEDFDVDGDGAISMKELVAAAKLFRTYRNLYKRLGLILIVLLFTLCLIFGYE